MKTVTVTFVGGSQDLTRRVVEYPNGRSLRVPRVRRNPALGSLGSIEGSLYEDLGYFEEVYDVQTAFDRYGREVHVAIFSYDTDQTPSEITRLRKQLEQAKADNGGILASRDEEKQRADFLKKQLDMALDVSIKRGETIAKVVDIVAPQQDVKSNPAAIKPLPWPPGRQIGHCANAQCLCNVK